MEDLKKILSSGELFSNLKTDSINRVISRLKRETFEEGSIICAEGDIGDRLYLIVSGEVAALQKMGWGNRELRRLGENEVVGEMALITRDTRSATIKALTRTECLTLDQSDFTWLLENDPHLAQRTALVLSKRLSSLGQKMSSDLLRAYRALMFSMVKLADSRDKETGAHIERTRNYCAFLAEKLKSVPRYSNEINSDFVDSIYDVSPLHDIGKVSVPDAILLKPGKLDAAEFEIIKTHTTAGADALKMVLKACDQDIFKMAYNICLNHHEKWDGSGYPEGLAGEKIPLEARIMAIADVYDALLTQRVYKPAFSYAQTAQEIQKSAGTHFDPYMVEVFTGNIREFEAIHKQMKENPQ